MRIAWSRPWLAAYRARGEPLWRAVQEGATVAEALNREVVAAADAGPHRFVPAAALPAGEAYEAFVARTACIPTRDNLHDFFNGLVWLHSPALKAQLNHLHAQALAVAGVQARRGPLRDAATLFDESGALLQAPAPLAEALRQRDWPRLFIELRPQWREARLQLFGHALLEKLQQPRKAICAQVLLVPALETVQLDAALLAGKPFQPLPLLGLPGWWPANEVADFYADPLVFRPPRPAQSG